MCNYDLAAYHQQVCRSLASTQAILGTHWETPQTPVFMGQQIPKNPRYQEG